MVVMGESNAYGMNASRPSCEWVQKLAELIREHQDGPLAVLNNAIPGNLVSSTTPPPADAHRWIRASRPTAIERYQGDMIDHEPDLAVFAYGGNDAAAGHDAARFLDAYDHIVGATRARLPHALVVIVGPCWNIRHDPIALDDHIRHLESRGERALIDEVGGAVVGKDLLDSYRVGIEEIAGRYGAVYIDLFPLLEGATWLLHDDAEHFNDVGQALIGMTVFAGIAANCSFVAAESLRAEHELRTTKWSTGGTHTMAETYHAWREPERRDWNDPPRQL
jgi:lysophospholipase L1-like esterase